MITEKKINNKLSLEISNILMYSGILGNIKILETAVKKSVGKTKKNIF